jgi:HEAT repeat protein
MVRFIRSSYPYSFLLAIWCIGTLLSDTLSAQPSSVNPWQQQVTEQLNLLNSPDAGVRAGAAEALGYLRAYSAGPALLTLLDDDAQSVRREAAMSLAWCGNRDAVPVLLGCLDDIDWTVRQAAWVALTNLTGMSFTFDGLATTEDRQQQIAVWKQWWQSVPNNGLPNELHDLIRSADPEERLRAVRALAAFGSTDAPGLIESAIKPYLKQTADAVQSAEKNIVLSGLRGLGRLRFAGSFPVLLEFLGTVDWARYAADALADFGDRHAVIPLTETYPRFALNLQDAGAANLAQVRPADIPKDDRPTNSPIDRMYETPFAIIAALSRLPLDHPDDIAALRKIGLQLLINMPSDYDGGVLYEEEAYQHIMAYLLEKVGMRQTAVDAAFTAFAQPLGQSSPALENAAKDRIIHLLAGKMNSDSPFAAPWLPAFCTREDIPRLLPLLKHTNGWVRINAAKALMFLEDTRAIAPISHILETAPPEQAWGFAGALEQAEYHDPPPRWREAYIRALGRLHASQADELLADIVADSRNVVEIQFAAAIALDELGTSASLSALQAAETSHPFHSVRLVAREALWRRDMLQTMDPADAVQPAPATCLPSHGLNGQIDFPIVFIKGNNILRSDYNGQAGVDPWRQTYTITNSGPTWRVGQNLYIRYPDGRVEPLTRFTSGLVADCEVSWDGTRIIFSRRLNSDMRHAGQATNRPAALQPDMETQLGGDTDPWWHIWEINVDGTGLRQLTFGPYHDVQPAYLGDGRVVFSSTRIGLRDEYHGYPSTGLSVMNADGTDIHPIGFNFGGDREPAVTEDGRIVFSRLDNFYSRLKTEHTIQSVAPDGTRNEALYGPERRPFWREVHKTNAAWNMRNAYNASDDNRNRVLRLSQPQPFGRGRLVCASSGGLVVIGPGRYEERLIPHDRKMAVTTPFSIGENQLLCAATVKQFHINGKIITAGTDAFPQLKKGPDLFKSAVNIDLALYVMDAETGNMRVLYNDPETAEFEARPIVARKAPAVLAENSDARGNGFTAAIFCQNAFNSRHQRVTTTGKLVRVIEGQPFVARHETHLNPNSTLWKNHGGTHARVLGTVPLAADGSFYVEVPADRLLQMQILDSDRRVVGNQLFWMYARPGETRSCNGCHENRNQTQIATQFSQAAGVTPIPLLPNGDEFTYRAKAWMKGAMAEETEERTRTARAVNLIGRY